MAVIGIGSYGCKADGSHSAHYIRGLDGQRFAMTGTMRSSDGLDDRRKRVLLRSWRRGIREMDLILGGFADRQLHALTEDEVEQYEALLDLPDLELYAWMTGERQAPESVASPLFHRIAAAARQR